MRRFSSAAVLSLALFGSYEAALAERSQLIPETTVLPHGLTRTWFTQVALDNGGGKLTSLMLYEGVVYAGTDKAILQAIDAETGRTLWWRQIGDPSHPSLLPGMNRDYLALINGSRLYVLNRLTGEVLIERAVEGSPGAGPAVSARRVYVPTTTGMVLAYRLAKAENPKVEGDTESLGGDMQAAAKERLKLKQQMAKPMFCQSYGKALVQPLMLRESPTEELVLWPTDRGLLNVARIDRNLEDSMQLRYRVETGAAIVGRPAFVPADPKQVGDAGSIVVASRDGYVYNLSEKDGKELWRFSVGEPIVETPAVIGDCVYVSAQLGGLQCLEMKAGTSRWFAGGVKQFVAASKSRVYATDSIGRLLVLDAKTGRRLDAVPTESASIKMLNTVTDRIYLGDVGGLVQCLREVELREPLVYSKDLTPADVEEKKLALPKAGKTEAVAPKVGPAKAAPAAKKAATKAAGER